MPILGAPSSSNVIRLSEIPEFDLKGTHGALVATSRQYTVSPWISCKTPTLELVSLQWIFSPLAVRNLVISLASSVAHCVQSAVITSRQREQLDFLEMESRCPRSGGVCSTVFRKSHRRSIVRHIWHNRSSLDLCSVLLNSQGLWGTFGLELSDSILARLSIWNPPPLFNLLLEGLFIGNYSCWDRYRIAVDKACLRWCPRVQN